MFLSRLDSAVRETKASVKIASITPTKSKKSSLLQELNEYLFDLFDANCMEEFHILQDFEDRAMQSFIDREESESRGSGVGDYDHFHYQLHREFVQLFEQMIDGFLKQQNCTMEDVFVEIERHHKLRVRDETDGDEKANIENSVDLIQVLTFYTDFSSWASMMAENARLRLRIKAMRK
jgi:hypothetical protein